MDCTPFVHQNPKKTGREKPHMLGLNHYLRVSSTVFWGVPLDLDNSDIATEDGKMKQWYIVDIG